MNDILFFVKVRKCVGSIHPWAGSKLVHSSHYAVITSWFIMFVWVCVSVRERKRDCVCEHVGLYCCMGLLFMDKLTLSCQISPLWSLQESWLSESGRDFTNLQSCHWYSIAPNRLSPNFDLHSSWYQTPTALQADKTRRHTEEHSS